MTTDVKGYVNSAKIVKEMGQKLTTTAAPTPTTVAPTTTTSTTTTATTAHKTISETRLTSSDVIIITFCSFLILGLLILLVLIQWKNISSDGSKANQLDNEGDNLQMNDTANAKLEGDTDTVIYTEITIASSSSKPAPAVEETEYATVRVISGLKN